MSYLKSPRRDDIKVRTIPECMKYWAEKRPDATGFVFRKTDGTREAVTWKELYDRSIEYGKAFRALGVKEKDVAAIAVRSQPKWLYLNFGLVFAGAIVLPIVFTYKDGSDVKAILNKLENCTTFILDPEYSETTWPIFKSFLKSSTKSGRISSDQIPALKYMVCTEAPDNNTDVLTLQSFLQKSDNGDGDQSLPTLDQNSVFTLFQTSGSTGIPKAVAHTHRSCYHVIIMFSQIYAENFEEEIFYNDRPFNWIGGWPINVITGETRVCRSGLSRNPEDPVEYIIDAIYKERCTTMIVLPPTLQTMMERAETDERFNDWPLKAVLTGGMPIASKNAAALDKIARSFLCIYGGTEFLMATYNKVDKKEDFVEYSCGIPAPGIEIKVVGDDGEILPLNQRGEIYLKTDVMFAGYFNDPVKTAAAFSSDGWYKTDDIGRISQEGHIYVEGRKSDMILSGGFNVPPSVLETLLKTCPGVKNVFVVPIPDEKYYQVICACVIREEGDPLGEDDLRRYCEDLHNDKRQMFSVLPTYYLFYESFPETRTGKTSRKDLAAISLRRIKESQN